MIHPEFPKSPFNTVGWRKKAIVKSDLEKRRLYLSDRADLVKLYCLLGALKLVEAIVLLTIVQQGLGFIHMMGPKF